MAMLVGAGGQDQLDRYRGQLATMPPGQAAPAMALNNPAIASAVAQWRAVRETDALPFDTYAGFLMAHPGWPGEAALRRAAERKAGEASPGSAVAFFTRFPPQTAAAGVAYAQALLSSGQTRQAQAAARDAWRRGALSTADELSLQASFAGALSPADQDARMDALLWQGAVQPATRQLLLVSANSRDRFAARLALRSDAPEAAAFATQPAPAWMGDAGYLADRAGWLRRHQARETARALLATRPALSAPPSDPTRWLQLLLSVAQDAAADGQWQQAYDIARRVDDAYPAGTAIGDRSYAERDAYTDLVWLAAQAAWKHLGRPTDAGVLFERYAGGSRSPSIGSKGLYWAGRAAEAGGLASARDYFTRAAAFRDQYYGQLAAEHLGQPLVAPPPIVPRAIDPATRAAFYNRQVVQAAQLLGQINDPADQTFFVRQIAQDAKSDSDHLLAVELSRTLNRPDLGVMVGRSALMNGLPDYSLAGFPTVSVPATEQANWTMIHAIARQESQFDRNALSRTGARGLMQLMPGTARDSAGKIGMAWDSGMLTASTDYNIQLGSYYFGHIFALYGSYPLAIAAYNAGPGNVNKWLRANGDPRTGAIDPVDWVEAIPFGETRNYVQRVLENAVVYDLANPAHAKSTGAARLSWYLGRRPN
jgi:soluble lytic murein transglycosylase